MHQKQNMNLHVTRSASNYVTRNCFLIICKKLGNNASVVGS